MFKNSPTKVQNAVNTLEQRFSRWLPKQDLNKANSTETR